MKHSILLGLACLLFANPSIAQNNGLSPYDANKPIGWCMEGTGTTGDATNNIVHVQTYDALKSELRRGTTNKTIIIDNDIYFPEKLFVGGVSNITIYGMPGTKLYNYVHTADQDSSGCFYVKESNNLIFRNLDMQGAGAFDNSSADCMQLVTCQNVWVDHCNFQDGVDGCLDLKTGTDNVSITWCRFRYLIEPWADGKGGANDHRFPLLIGSGDKNTEDVGHLNTTIAYCWFDEGCMERTPRVRKGKIHVVNCDYTNVGAHYLVGPGYLANIYEEKCDMSAISYTTDYPKWKDAGTYKTLQWKNYATEKKYKGFNLKMVDCVNAVDIDTLEGNAKQYDPYTDGGNSGVVAYDKTLVKAFVENADNGAGPTLDADLLATRGNSGQQEPTTGISNIANNGATVVATYYYSVSGVKSSVPQPGLNIVRQQMSDGTLKTFKSFER